ncbi:MAG: hypothetical protein ACP5XB_11850, partial [Isosphaeraceae bacterium]
ARTRPFWWWGFRKSLPGVTIRGVGEVRAEGMSVPSCVAGPGVLQRVQPTAREPSAWKARKPGLGTRGRPFGATELATRESGD